MNERLLSVVATGCGGDLAASNTESILTSPGYPSNYSAGLDCQWTITATAGHQIAVRLTDVNIEGRGYGLVTYSLCPMIL